MRKRVYRTSELRRMDQQAQRYYVFPSIYRYCAFLLEVPDQSRSILARERSCNNRNFNNDIPDNHFSSEDHDNVTQQRSKERRNYQIINVWFLLIPSVCNHFNPTLQSWAFVSWIFVPKIFGLTFGVCYICLIPEFCTRAILVLIVFCYFLLLCY